MAVLHNHQRVAVCRRTGYDFRADDAAGASTVFRDHLLLQHVTKCVGEHTSNRISAAAGR